MAQAGHAVWKFKSPNWVMYKNSHAGAISWFYNKIDQPFSIWIRSRKGGWEYVCDNVVPDRCNCGRLYTDTHNGLEFRWKNNAFATASSLEDCKEIFEAPTLCQICYYKIELDAGRFCPKWVKQQLIDS